MRVGKYIEYSVGMYIGVAVLWKFHHRIRKRGKAEDDAMQGIEGILISPSVYSIRVDG